MVARRRVVGPMSQVVTEGFHAPQVCSLVGITYRQLDYWARTDLLTPSIAPASGSGSQRLYSYEDVLELKVIKRLLDGGLKLTQTRRAIACLRDALGEDLTNASLVLSGPTSLLVRSGEELIDLLHGGQGVLNVVPLAGVIDEMDAAVHAIPRSSSQAAELEIQQQRPTVIVRAVAGVGDSEGDELGEREAV
jgi:DNA-binding transcriptional MerR regulator